jgi:hypothetical protein
MLLPVRIRNKVLRRIHFSVVLSDYNKANLQLFYKCYVYIILSNTADIP